VLRRRLARSPSRPSLTGADPLEELAEVLAAREPFYRECAQTTVETAKRSIDEVADVIEQLWSLLPDHDLR
jgi:shikimate kinase